MPSETFWEIFISVECNNCQKAIRSKPLIYNKIYWDCNECLNSRKLEKGQGLPDREKIKQWADFAKKKLGYFSYEAQKAEKEFLQKQRKKTSFW